MNTELVKQFIPSVIPFKILIIIALKLYAIQGQVVRKPINTKQEFKVVKA